MVYKKLDKNSFMNDVRGIEFKPIKEEEEKNEMDDS